MILLLSASHDANLDYVIEWLAHHRHPWLRINSDDPLHARFHLQLAPSRLAIGERHVPLDDIRAIWLRQFGHIRRSAYWHEATRLGARADALDQIAREHAVALGGLQAVLADRYWLTRPAAAHVNKLDMLHQAAAVGLAIPETHVITRAADLRALLATGDYICKSLYEPMFLKDPEGFYAMYTTRLDPDEVDALVPPELTPSLVQRLIAKAYELRVFYLDGTCYAMAIFSQQRARTALDFRAADWTDPPRQVPYALPDDVAARIDAFMRAIGLNCGSLDLIRTPDGRYVFLEVNPAGQFGMVAFPCNYPLYEHIALHLIAHDRT